jgi:putative DNA primase/helicase
MSMYGDETKYSIDSNYFLNYNGKYWSEDKTESLTHGRCLHVIKTIPRECGDDADPKIIDTYKKFRVSCGNFGKLESMKKSVAKLCSLTYEDCDKDQWLFNVANGTVDLRNGTIREHNKQDMLTKCSGVTYNKDADCPTFKEFLNVIFKGDASLIKYVQCVLGYSLSGDISEQKIFIMKGTGGNGKSTLMSVMMSLMGSYACCPRMDTFVLGKNSETGRNDLANIRGARMANSAEPNKGVFFDMELLKKISGGEPIRCRFLYSKNEMEYTPTYKVLIQCNHLPNIQSNGDSAERRFRVIPFDVRIAEKDRDEQLVEKLLSESSGILNWLIEGCQTWYARPSGHRLPECAAVLRESRDYMSDQDPIGSFIREQLTPSNGNEVLANEIFTEYEAWRRLYDKPEFKSATFTKTLKEHGLHTRHTEKGTAITDYRLTKNFSEF